MEQTDYHPRLEKLREAIRSRRLDGLLVAGKANIRYLSGFTGNDAWALVTPARAFLITDFRYREQAAEELSAGFKLKESKGGLVKTALSLSQRLRLQRVGFEKRHLSFELYEGLKEGWKGKRLVPAGPLVEKSRLVKEAGEIERLRQAALLTDWVLERTFPSLKAGMTELDAANSIVSLIGKTGGKEAFEPIVAFGPHSSRPHAVPSRKTLEKGSIVLIDMGVKSGGYNSDITRTFAFTEFPPRFKKIYGLVLEAQKRALEAVKPGVKASSIDRRARAYLREKGFGRFFGHSLGHGVGLEVHEGPTLRAGSGTVLQEGMVFTVEPALYLPGWGGVRIEDTVLVTSDGCEELTRFPKGVSNVLFGPKKCCKCRR